MVFLGSNNQPLIVVVEEGIVIEATRGSTFYQIDGGFVGNKKMKYEIGLFRGWIVYMYINWIYNVKWNGNGRKWVCDISLVDPIRFVVQLNMFTFALRCDIMYGYYKVMGSRHL